MPKDDKRKKPRAVKDKKSGQTVAAPGYKMATTPKRGESATKQITPVKGASSVTSKNGPYIPQPVAKSPSKAAPAKKSSYKGGSKKAAFGSVNKMKRRQNRGGLKKC